AKQTANLFGNDVQLFEASVGTDAVAAATQILSRRQVQVFIAASAVDAERLSNFAEQRHIIFLNVASRSQALRAACRRYTFHVEASETMYASAILPARQAAAWVTGGGSSLVVRASVVVWWSAPELYGACQINDGSRPNLDVRKRD